MKEPTKEILISSKASKFNHVIKFEGSTGVIGFLLLGLFYAYLNFKLGTLQ
jgi:hypothetical protein